MVDLNIGTGPLTPDEGDGLAGIGVIQDAGRHLAPSGSGMAHLAQIPGQHILADIAPIAINIGLFETE